MAGDPDAVDLDAALNGSDAKGNFSDFLHRWQARLAHFQVVCSPLLVNSLLFLDILMSPAELPISGNKDKTNGRTEALQSSVSCH